MKATMMRWAVVVALVGTSVVPAMCAEQGSAQKETAQKTLPTLLIKGEVVSVDTTDAAATLLKVKDRYGFETPIYLTQDTKVAQGSQTLAAANLTPGTAVEVEYNFDINTAKRHAVRVELGAPATSASTATPAAATAPATSAASVSPAAPSAKAASAAAPAMPSTTTPSTMATPAAPAMPAAKATPSAPAATSAATTPPAPTSAAAPASAGGTTAKEHPGKEHAGTTTQ